jgi:hydrogenase maturation protease
MAKCSTKSCARDVGPDAACPDLAEGAALERRGRLGFLCFFIVQRATPDEGVRGYIKPIDIEIMGRVLIIAYGNPLRSDDGLGWRAAEALEGRFTPDQVEIVRVHQLAPELAEAISRSDGVILLDAATPRSTEMKPGDIQVEDFERDKADQSSRFCHAFSPGSVLELAAELYGVEPRAFFVTMIGEDFAHGECLSPRVAAALPAMVGRIEALVEEIVSAKANLKT